MRMSQSLIISQYSLPEAEFENICRQFDEKPKPLVISNMIHSGYMDLIRQFRSRSWKTLIIYVNPTASGNMLPILRLMSFMIPASRRFFLDADNQPRPFGLGRGIVDIGAVVWALFHGVFALVFITLMMMALNRLGRNVPDYDAAMTSKRFVYLRPSLWHGLRTGGANAHMVGVIGGLLEHGFHVDCVTDDRIDIVDAGFENQTVDSSHAFTIPRELNNFNFQFDIVRHIKNRLGSSFKGVFYQRLSVGSTAGVVVSRWCGMPLVTEYNGSETWLASHWSRVYWLSSIIDYLEVSILRHSHLIVTVSNTLKAELISKGLPEDRILVNPNGVDFRRFASSNFDNDYRQSLRGNFGFLPEDQVFTFVGSFGAWHGASLLADAIAGLLSSKNQAAKHIKFLLVGNGREYPQVSDELASFIDRGQVVMTGAVDFKTIPELIMISDVCVAPTIENSDGSEFFGSPTKLFEYMASGKPTIASCIGQVKDIMAGSHDVEDIERASIQDGAGVGVLFRANDKEELKKAILYLAANPELGRRMGMNAARVAEELHTWGNRVSLLIARLQELRSQAKNRTLRVLVNAIHSRSGGGVTYLRNILPLLARDVRIEIHVLMHEEQHDTYSDYLSGCKVHYLHYPDTRLRTLFYEQVFLPVLARRLNMDVVFSPANYGPIFAGRSVILLRNALGVAFEEKRPSKIIYWLLLYSATFMSIVAARRIISVSNYASRSCPAVLVSLLRHRLDIVPHGVGAAFVPQKIARRRESEMLAVSDLYVQKNLHRLIEAFSLIVDRFPDVKLLIAGKPIDQDYADILHKSIIELELEGRVEFLGSVETDKLVELYQRCTLFVFPSTVETFGNPIVEAMACGAPVASSNAAAMPEVAGDAAVYFDPRNIEHMASVLSDLLSDPAKRAELSVKSLEHSRLFSWEITAEKLTENLLKAGNYKC